MPLLLAGLRAMLWGLILSILETVVSKLLLMLGIGFVTYNGVSIFLDRVSGYIQSSLSGLAADMYAILSIAGLGNVLSIIISAFVIKATLMGMSAAGSVTSVRLGKK